MDRTLQVDVDHPVHELVGGVHERPDDVPAGDVREHVESADLRLHVGGDRSTGAPVRHVERREAGVVADLVHGLPATPLVHVRHGDGRLDLGHRPHGGTADARAGAGDRRDLVDEVPVVSWFPTATPARRPGGVVDVPRTLG